MYNNIFTASGAKYSNALLNMEDVVIVLQQMNERITELETNVLALATEVQRLEQQAGKPAAGRGNPQRERQDVPKGRMVQDLPVLTAEQQRLFDRAIQAGLMERLPDGRYHWRESKALLAYFCGRVFCGDSVKREKGGECYWRQGKGAFPGVECAAIFGVGRLGDYRQKRSYCKPPKGYEMVDAL